MEASGPYKTSFSRKLGIVSVVVLLIFCMVVTIQAVWSHDTALQSGERFAERLTEIESDHIAVTLSSASVALKGEADKYYFNSLFGKSGSNQMEQEFRKLVMETPQSAWILITDADGNVDTIGTRPLYQQKALSKKKLANEKYFQYYKKYSTHIESPQGLYISIDSSDHNLIVLSRPIFGFEGKFAGIIAFAVDANNFFKFFSSIDFADKIGMGIMISNEEQVILAQGTSRPNVNLRDIIENDQSLKNADLSKAQVRRMRIEGRDYIISFEKLEKMPVMVSLIFDEEEILATWRSDRMNDLVFLILFTAFGVVLFSLILAMAKQIQRSEESERRALLANQAKSEFFAKMSHELRTPLNAIIGFSEMIDSGYFGPLNNKKQQERIHDINLCGNHLLQLINDILDYSKGEAGKLEIREGEVTLSKVVDESVRMIREKAKFKNINLSTNIAPNLPRLLADEKKLKQVLLNLLSNSVKFTKEGGSVRVEAAINPANELEVHVIDTGIGIPEEDIPVALSVFGQVKNRHEIDEEGTGLGLPLSKMLIELHGGRFHLTSELGKGTDVSFILPVTRVVVKKGRRSKG